MQAGIVGAGRMGKELVRRMASQVSFTVYDRELNLAKELERRYHVKIGRTMEDIIATGTVILAVPDQEVINCIKEFNLQRQTLTVINVATNVARVVLEEIAAKHIRCIGVKFVGHAGEMANGLAPVIIIDDRPAELVPMAVELFSGVGKVVVGKADIVGVINTLAAEKALEAAVYIEEELFRQNITDPDIVKSAISQVATGILKAYSDQDLGPFAREIVRAVRARRKAVPMLKKAGI